MYSPADEDTYEGERICNKPLINKWQWKCEMCIIKMIWQQYAPLKLQYSNFQLHENNQNPQLHAQLTPKPTHQSMRQRVENSQKKSKNWAILMEIQHFQGRIDRVVTVHTENELYRSFAPISLYWQPKQTSKGCGRADSDRKQSKEEHKQTIIYGDTALSGKNGQGSHCAHRKWILLPALAPFTTLTPKQIHRSMRQSWFW